MRMKMVCDDRTLREISNEFLALKKAQKIRDRTLSDYKKYIDKFLAQSQNTRGYLQSITLHRACPEKATVWTMCYGKFLRQAKGGVVLWRTT